MISKIEDLFATILQIPPEEVRDSLSPEFLDGWDSFQHMILVSAFEEEFDISVEPEEIVEMYKDFKTFKNIILEKIV